MNMRPDGKKGKRARFETKQPFPSGKEVFAPRRQVPAQAVPSSYSHPKASSSAVVRTSRKPARRVRINLWVIEKRLWGLLGIALALSVWLSPVTQPRILVFQGVPEGAQRSLASKVQESWRSPFSWKMGYGVLSKTVAGIPWVESCRVNNFGLRQIRAQVIPRTPIAKVRLKHRVLWLDAEGVPFDAPNPLNQLPVSSIQISNPSDLNEGQVIQQKSLKHALDVLQLLRAYELPQQVVLTMSQNHDINLFLREPANQQRLRVLLGDGRKAAAQVEVLANLFQRPEMLQNCEYLNLLSPDAPALMTKEAERKRQ